MIPNCQGCEIEIEEAYFWQELGYNVVLENMGVRNHCFFIALDKKDKIVAG